MPSRSTLFWIGVAALALGAGLLVAYRVLLEPGVVGLFHDWSLPAARGQALANAAQLFDGWQARGLGAPLDYPTDYPFWFGLALAARLGMEPAMASKAILVAVPALALVSMAYFARTIGFGRPATVLCSFVYALSPVLMNKLIAGQIAYLFAYALIPLVPAITIRALRGTRPVRAGLLLGALLGLISMQLQLGAIGVAAVLVLALTCGSLDRLGRVRLCCAVGGTLFAVELPTVVALVLNHATTTTARVTGIPETLEWLRYNSVGPLEAFRLVGYATRYDEIAIAQWFGFWSLAAYVVAATALVGLWLAPAKVRWLAASSLVAALLLITGVHSPIAPVLIWAFVHFPPAAILRELYHLMVIPALIYALGIGYFWESRLAGAAGSPQRWGLITAVAVFLAPLASGNCIGFVGAHPFDAEMNSAYDVVASSERRVAWFPIDQPLNFLDNGAGVDPMGVTQPGSLWTYTLTWPLTALDLYARSSDWHRATQGLRALGVGWVVDRPDFDSLLWMFANGGSARQYYLRRPITMPALARVALQAFPYDRLYPLDGLPKMYGAGMEAFVAPRLEVAGAVADRGLVPLGFDLRPSAGLPYVVVRDPGDELDEMLAGRGTELKLVEQSQRPEFGFASLPDSWFFTPAYAEARSGIMTFGTHRVSVAIGRPLNDGAIVVSWIGTPLGGRVRVRVGDRAVVVDTRASPASWRSTLLRVGARSADDRVFIDALDAPASVAIRSVRAVDGDALARATLDYRRLLRGATRVLDWRETSTAPFRLYDMGHSRNVGTLVTGREFRLSVRCPAKQGAYVWAMGPGEQAFAYARIDPRRGGASMDFAGVGDAVHIAGTCNRFVWTLAQRPLAFPDGVLARVAARRLAVQPGRFGGVRASLSGSARIAVLNVTYGTNWRADGPGEHVATALGTNAWILPATHGPIAVENTQTLPFHVAFIAGVLALIAGIVAPFVGWRRAA